MKKLLIILISLLLCVATVFPTVNDAGTNDLLRELITINTKTDNLLKELTANKIKYSGNTTGYASTVILKWSILITFPAVIIYSIWHCISDNYLCDSKLLT